MEEKFNNSQEERQFQQFQEYQNVKKKRKKTQKGLAFRLWWLFSFININYCWCNCVYWNFVNEVDKEINEEGKLDKDKDTKIKSIGETTEIDGVSFTLDNASYTEERNEFADVQADKVIKVDMTVKTILKKKFQ